MTKSKYAPDLKAAKKAQEFNHFAGKEYVGQQKAANSDIAAISKKLTDGYKKWLRVTEESIALRDVEISTYGELMKLEAIIKEKKYKDTAEKKKIEKKILELEKYAKKSNTEAGKKDYAGTEASAPLMAMHTAIKAMAKKS